MISDWELAERHAFQSQFNMDLHGCLFHRGQAIWRKVQELGMSTAYIKESKVRFFVWHILAMAHVPLQDHPQAIQIIEDDLEGFEDDSGSSPSAMRLFEDASKLYR